MSENVPLDMCTVAQSDQKLHWAHFGEPRMQVFFMKTMKTLIRQCGCTGCFEASLDVHVRTYVFPHCGLSSYERI